MKAIKIALETALVMFLYFICQHWLPDLTDTDMAMVFVIPLLLIICDNTEGKK